MDNTTNRLLTKFSKLSSCYAKQTGCLLSYIEWIQAKSIDDGDEMGNYALCKRALERYNEIQKEYDEWANSITYKLPL